MTMIPLHEVLAEITGITPESGPEQVDAAIKAFESLPDDFVIDMGKYAEAVEKRIEEAKNSAPEEESEPDDFEKGILDDMHNPENRGNEDKSWSELMNAE